jgi:hypothetical protein
MTSVSFIELNESACLLLSQGSVSKGLDLFKKALSALKIEIQGQSTDLTLLPSEASLKLLYQEEQQATVGTVGGCFCCLLPATKASKKEHERFWIYSRPLSMQRVTDCSECLMWRNHFDVLTISFNVALASHLQGLEQELGGDSNAANHSFKVAMKMYTLTLCQCQASYQKHGVIFNKLIDHVYAAILSNLAHVYVMLGEMSQCTAYAEQLLKALFYLMDSGRVTTTREATTHNLLLENAHCLLMASSNSAAAA